MYTPDGTANPALNMTMKRVITAVLVLGLGQVLTSCGGAAGDGGLSGYVADHWPHWAGGLPPDVPPRPGSPGYTEFISHGGADPNAAAEASAVQPKPVQTTAPAGSAQAAQAEPASAPAPTAEAAPPDGRPAEDTSVVKGGLY